MAEVEPGISNYLRPILELIFGALFLTVSHLYVRELTGRIKKEEDKNAKQFALLEQFQTGFKEELKNNREEMRAMISSFEKFGSTVTNSIKRVHCRIDELVKKKVSNNGKTQAD